MKRILKILLSTLLMSAMLASALPAVSAKGYDNTIEVKISGVDTKTDDGYFFVYPNKTDSVRKIKADEYNFRNVKIFVFDKDGKMIEAGENMIANSATQSGSIQEYLSIPAGGFALAFKSGGSPELTRCYAAVTENAMHYNSTISVIQDAKGSYNDTHVTVEYNNLKKSPDAKKYLFIGNSATYVNGTPLKFKGLALAAGKDVDVEYGTFGSSYLSEFANENHQYGISFRQKLRLKKYDYVVLQDAGSCIYYNTQPAVKALLPLIEANGAEALLYMRYSASSTPAGRIEGAQQHFDNYSKLSEEFGLPYAPAALAYVICTEKYPEIDLYSDDNSHHSKEGSYLIACTMLMSYLGVDPRGNSYDAQLGETAAKLQECAYIACTEGYEFDKKPTKADEFTDKNGNKYSNIAVSKPYTVTGSVYSSDKWTDANADGTPIGKLTDGQYAEDGTDPLIGCWNGEGHSVTIDLGSISQVRAFKTDMHGNTGWGITDPKDATVSFAVSNDGVKFTELGDAKASKGTVDGDWSRYEFSLELGAPVMAKYVRVTYNSGKFNWVSEISVYGTEGEGGNTEGSDTSADESAPAESNTESTVSEGDEYVEHENKSIAWLYWVIGAVVLVAVIAIAIVITKKKK